MSNEQQIEQEIQDKGLNAPRLTPDHIDSVIQSVHYFTAGDGFAGELTSSEEFNSLPEDERFVNPPQQLDLLTFCVIILKNGFTVTGESACASPENFDPEIGKKIAYQNAREKIWLLEGYLLKEKLYQTAQQPKTHIERMLEEKEALDVKLNALKSFLAKVATNEAPMLTDDQVGNLEEQCEAMQSYSDVLGIRIEYDKEYLKAVGG
jgi:regulator of replication initiation timing